MNAISTPLSQNRGRVYLDHAAGIPQELLNQVAAFVAWYDRRLKSPYDLTVFLQIDEAPCPWHSEVEYRSETGELFALDDPDTAGIGLHVQALPDEHPHLTVQRVAHALEHQHQWERGGRIVCKVVDTRAAQLVSRWLNEGSR